MSSIKEIGRYIAQVVINVTTRKQESKGRVSGTISKHVIIGRVNVFIDWVASFLFFLFLETKLVD